MRARIAVLVAAVSLAGASAACAGAPGGGLYGLVTRGPTQPVCQVGKPCSGPAPHLTLVFVRNGASTRVTTSSTGRYRIALAPGVYAVRTTQPGPGRGIDPAQVRVRGGAFARQNFFVDTGIR